MSNFDRGSIQAETLERGFEMFRDVSGGLIFLRQMAGHPGQPLDDSKVDDMGGEINGWGRYLASTWKHAGFFTRMTDWAFWFPNSPACVRLPVGPAVGEVSLWLANSSTEGGVCSNQGAADPGGFFAQIGGFWGAGFLCF